MAVSEVAMLRRCVFFMCFSWCLVAGVRGRGSDAILPTSMLWVGEEIHQLLRLGGAFSFVGHGPLECQQERVRIEPFIAVLCHHSLGVDRSSRFMLPSGSIAGPSLLNFYVDNENSVSDPFILWNAHKAHLRGKFLSNLGQGQRGSVRTKLQLLLIKSLF